MEVCETCGSDQIALVEDRDDSVGYSSEEYRCLRCGANCEYMESSTPTPIELIEQLTTEERLVASIAIVMYRKGQEDRRAA